MKPIMYFFTAGLLLIASQVFSQPLVTTLTPATVTSPIGSTVDLQLKVTNFNNINSIQFPITYNAAVLEFDTILNSTLPGFVSGNFNVPAPGKVVVTWFPDPSMYPTGFSVPDNSSIFTLRFTVLTNGSSTVNLSTASPGIEVIANDAPLQVNYQSGGSSVTGGSGGSGPLTGFKIIANTIYIPQGTVGCMPVTVNDFTTMSSMQYAMHWNKDILQYQNTAGYNLPDLTAGSFGGTPANGLLLLGWTDPNPVAGGVTRSNGTKIYDVCFNAVGPVGSQSLITIDSIGFAPGSGGAEAYNNAGQNVWTSTSGVTDTIFVVTAPPPSDAVTFTAVPDTAVLNGQGCIDISVANFEDIIAMQFGITYNVNQLVYQSIDLDPNPLGLTTGSFNPNTPGQIVFTWNDPLAMGVTLPNNTVIFSVCFTAVAPIGTTAGVNFSSLSQPPLPIEVVKEPDGPVNPAMVNGHVYVDSVAGPIATISTQPACGSNTGTATATVMNGTATSYAWSGPSGPITGNQQTITGLAGGNYIVTVTLTGGATITAPGTVLSSPIMTIPTPQVNITPVQCFGQNNGAVNLTVMGGTSPFIFNWDGPGTFDADTEDITGLGPGNYVLNVTDSRGCSITSQPFPVTEPGVLTVALDSSQNVTCLGSSTGKAFITVTGGTPTYSYSWRTVPGGQLVSTAKNPMSLPTGVFSVTVTDGRNCTATLSNPVDITGPQTALAVASPVQKEDVVCWGYNTGSITLGISGGWNGAYSVNWTPQVPGGANPQDIPAGNYSGTVTDAGGCEIVVAVEIQGPPAIEYINGTPNVVHNVCANDGDGSISIEVDGGNGGPFTVAWNGTSLSGTTIGSLDGGIYTPIVTETNTGCTAALPGITVNEPAPIDTANAVIIVPEPGVPGSISLDIIGGTGAYTISWTGPGSFSAITEDISNLTSAGNYVLSVTDANGCVFTRTFPLLGALSFSYSSTPSCGNDGCINLEILGGAPPFQVTWNGGPGPVFSDDFSLSICTFAPGVYNLTIADNAGNAFTETGIPVQGLDPALVSANDVPPSGASSNGSITLTPVPDTTTLTYQWSGPGVNGMTSNAVINLDSGLYVVTVTNVNSGCESIYEFPLDRVWPLLVVPTPQTAQPTCTYSTNGTITVSPQGGNPVYTYTWSGPNGPISNNSPTLNNAAPGTYSVTVTDLEGTTTTTATTLNAQSQLAVSNVNVTSNYGGFPVSGADECDGVANVVFSGGVGATNILWSNNISAAQNSTLCAGQYSVIVTDGLGCTSSWSGELPSPPAISPEAQTISSVSCHGECDGVVRVFLSGGVSPYTASWSTGQTDQVTVSGGFTQAVNLCGGDYTVTITDNLGATKVYAVPLPDPEEISITFASVEPTDFTSCDGEFIAEAPTAVAPITYTWSSNLGRSGNSQRAEGLCSGEIVTFVLYDGNGCAGVGIDTVPFREDDCLQVRPVLTPGEQDGNNDFLFITCIENGPNSIEIFNRWGQLVFETTNYNNSSNRWEGTNKSGQPLAEGVYFYVLNYTDPVKGPTQRKGHINLLR